MRRDGNAGAGGAGAIGLFNAEGRLVSKDRVFTDTKRFQVEADFPGLLINMVKRYVAGLPRAWAHLAGAARFPRTCQS